MGSEMKAVMAGLVLVLLLVPSVLCLSFEAYNPYKIAIDRVEASGQINVLEEADQFIVRKNNSVVFVVPRECGWYDLRLRPGPGSYGTGPTDYTIQLESNDENILVCHWQDLGTNRQRTVCDRSITTNIVSIEVELDRPDWSQRPDSNYTILSDFIISGSIDGDDIAIYGNTIYDNTAESRAEYAKGIDQAIASWNATNLFLLVAVFGGVGAVVLWFVISFVMIARNVLRSREKTGKFPKKTWLTAYLVSFAALIASMGIAAFGFRLIEFWLVYTIFPPFNFLAGIALVLSIIAFTRRKEI